MNRGPLVCASKLEAASDFHTKGTGLVHITGQVVKVDTTSEGKVIGNVTAKCRQFPNPIVSGVTNPEATFNQSVLHEFH